MIKFSRERLRGANCWLSVVEFGSQDQPVMIVLHGTHDHALGMLPAVASLQDRYRIIGLDLRGHGHSDKPGNYTLVSLVADLRALVDQWKLENVTLVGHSLGGVVASSFAAAYPDEVDALVMIDGMGPPLLQQPLTAVQRAQGIRHAVSSALRDGGRGRTMESLAEAEARFSRNNPGLDSDSVALIVREGTRPIEGEGYRWRFDPTIDLIFSTYHNADIEAMLSEVRCPVLLMIGEAAPAFWEQVSPLVSRDQGYFASEQERRRSLFSDASLVVIPGAAHSVHYDKPDAVQAKISDFLAACDDK